jgi:5-hydroxyisourate hydrolase-like protein (transthyretin family)
MAKARHLVKQLFLLLLIPVLAALYFAGPSNASAAPRATHFAAQSKPHHPKPPCGIKHYPRCPHPKNKCHHKHVKPGHKVHVHSKHYPKHSTIRVYIKGHGHHKLVVKIKTNKHGKAHYSVKVPKNFKPGKYKLIFKASGYHKHIPSKTITVKKTKHHHHGHH